MLDGWLVFCNDVDTQINAFVANSYLLWAKDYLGHLVLSLAAKATAPY